MSANGFFRSLAKERFIGYFLKLAPSTKQSRLLAPSLAAASGGPLIEPAAEGRRVLVLRIVSCARLHKVSKIISLN